jgi:hypothetical protein
MREHRSPSRLTVPLLPALALLGLGLAGCEQTPVQPSHAEGLASMEPAAQSRGTHAETVALDAVKPGVTGTSTLHRRDQGFTFRISASGLTPGHPVTLWAIDMESGAVGRAAGGIVGGGGSVNLAGNHCVGQGGKSPGTAPACGLIDPAGSILFALLEGDDEWSPGDQSVRWQAAGKPLVAMATHLVGS